MCLRLKNIIEVDGLRFRKLKEQREGAVFEECPVEVKPKMYIVVDKGRKWIQYTRRVTADDFGDFAYSFAKLDLAMKKLDKIIERVKGEINGK